MEALTARLMVTTIIDLTPGPGYNLVAAIKKKLRYGCLAMSLTHKKHLMAYAKAVILAEMADPKSKLYDKDVSAALSEVKLKLDDRILSSKMRKEFLRNKSAENDAKKKSSQKKERGKKDAKKKRTYVGKKAVSDKSESPKKKQRTVRRNHSESGSTESSIVEVTQSNSKEDNAASSVVGSL